MQDEIVLGLTNKGLKRALSIIMSDFEKDHELYSDVYLEKLLKDCEAMEFYEDCTIIKKEMDTREKLLLVIRQD